MNKKQRNRKLVTQNKRNRIINRRYTSTLKTLAKLFQFKLKSFTDNNNDKSSLKLEIFNIVKNLYSIIDKAVKKGILHKNTASRKKSKIGKLYFKIQY
jgi:small subunit ribosomal protein S20